MPKQFERLQNEFSSKIFQMKVTQEDLSFVKSNFPEQRFQIYQHNVLENLTRTLKITYPGIWKLLGDDCAKGLSYAYCQIREYLPKQGCLDYFGEFFSSFIRNSPDLSSYPYLHDYALYEWTKHLADQAQDSPSIQPHIFRNINEENIEKAIFSFIPACFLFTSDFPICAIHEIVYDTSGKEINIQQEKVFAIIARPDDEICTYWIKEETWIFVQELMKGNTIIQSSQIAERHNSQFDLAANIALILNMKICDQILV